MLRFFNSHTYLLSSVSFRLSKALNDALWFDTFVRQWACIYIYIYAHYNIYIYIYIYVILDICHDCFMYNYAMMYQHA